MKSSKNNKLLNILKKVFFLFLMFITSPILIPLVTIASLLLILYLPIDIIKFYYKKNNGKMKLDKYYPFITLINNEDDDLKTK